MLKPRTFKILATIIVSYGLLTLLAVLFPQSPTSLLPLVPLLSVYVFHKLGVPGLLEHDGLCGWGWCSPTWLGWLIAAVAFLTAAWLFAWGLGVLTAQEAKR